MAYGLLLYVELVETVRLPHSAIPEYSQSYLYSYTQYNKNVNQINYRNWHDIWVYLIIKAFVNYLEYFQL